MADITAIATQLEAILSTLADVDKSSLDSYAPIVDAQKISLLVVPFQQDGVMGYAGMGKHSYVHAHNVPCEFWVKVNSGNVAAAMQRGRDICLQAMRLLAANPTLNGTVLQLGSTYNGTQGQIGRYTIAPRYEERGTISFIIATLFVPVEIRETASWGS